MACDELKILSPQLLRFHSAPPPPRFWFHYIEREKKEETFKCLALLCCPVFKEGKSSKLSLIVLKIPSLQSRMFFTCVPVALPTQQQQHLGTKRFFFLLYLFLRLLLYPPHPNTHTHKKKEKKKGIFWVCTRAFVSRKVKNFIHFLEEEEGISYLLDILYVVHPPPPVPLFLVFLYYTAR